jgi:hypothetical protein
MSGQSSQMSRSEAIRVQKTLERGPGKTSGGSPDPNRGSSNGTNVKVPTK